MGSLGLPEIAFIFLVALLIFGPKKLPELGRTLGRGVAEFRRATDELKRSINTELALDESPVPPVLRTRRLEDPAEAQPPYQQPPYQQPPYQEPPQHEPVIVSGPPGEAPAMTEARTAGFPAPALANGEPTVAPEPPAGHEMLADHEPPAGHDLPADHEPVTAPAPDLPGHH
jgi:TatA/E family protein of Tat protein translocase